jgi:hypothetical protein
MPWFDLDEGHYSQTLPKEMEEVWELLRMNRSPSCDLRVTEYVVALRVLNYLEQFDHINEICAVSTLTASDERGKSLADLSIEWIGMDIVVSGYGSAICEGVFARPDLFPEFLPALNPFGLFAPMTGFLERYRGSYLQASATNDIEPMPDIPSIWSALLIGRIANTA